MTHLWYLLYCAVLTPFLSHTPHTIAVLRVLPSFQVMPSIYDSF